MKFSIITISFNAVNDIERTLLSVTEQDFQDFEYIVIDGASKDGTIDIIDRYRSPITYFISEPDTGIYNAMNKGIKVSSGDFCLFMNAGDAFVNEHVLTTASVVIDSSIDIYNGNTYYIKEGKIKWYRKAPKHVDLAFFYRTSICHQSSFIKTSLLKKYMYDEKYRMVSDGKFWKETIGLKHASYKAIDVDISCFDTTGITSTQAERGRQENEKVIKELLNEKQIAECEYKKKQWNSFFNVRRRCQGISRRFWTLYAILFLKNKLINLE